MMNLVGQCASHPNIHIGQLTYQFWYKLATAIKEKPEDRARREALLLPSLLQLVPVFAKSAAFPEDCDDWITDDEDEFRNFRMESLWDAVLDVREIALLLYVCPYCCMCVLILLCVCPHSAIFVSAYCCVCVLILLCVSSYCSLCSHTAIYVSAYYCVCPHTAVQVSEMASPQRCLQHMLPILTQEVDAGAGWRGIESKLFIVRVRSLLALLAQKYKY